MKPVFIEVGSCDFDNLDPLLLDGWTGYFIEPVPEYLASLMYKVSDTVRDLEVEVYFENLAISNKSGTSKITYLQGAGAPNWARGSAHLIESKENDLDNNPFLTNVQHLIKTIDVTTLTLDDFLDKHNITNIEIMKIDVEGHELDILNSYSWKIKPRHLKVEHTKVGLENVIEILSRNGYVCRNNHLDVFAFFNGSA